MSAEELRRRILGSLEDLDEHQLATIDRVLRMDWERAYGNPPFLLGLPKLEFGEGTARGSMEIRDLHRAPHGAAHGMVAFGLMDNVMGQAVVSVSPGVWVTLEVKVQFLRPLLPGPVTVEGRAVHVGKAVAMTEGRIHDREGRLCVLATGTYYLAPGRLEERGR